MDFTQQSKDVYEWLLNFVQGDNLHAFVIAVAIIAVTAVLTHMLTLFIRHVVQLDGVPLPSSSILVNIARITLWGLGIGSMLSICFGVDVNAIVAALGVGGIALSLGLQDTIKNFIGGLQVTVMKIIQPGDHVVVGSVEGIVHDVTWRQTIIHDYEKSVHIVPNAVINSATVTKIEPSCIVTTQIAFVGEGRDLDATIAEMEEKARLAVQAVAPLEKAPWILLTQITEYGFLGKMRFVLALPDNAREARDAALRAIAPYTRANAEELFRAGPETPAMGYSAPEE